MEDFLFFKEKIFYFAGIHLTEKKLSLVQSRIQSYLRKSNIKSIAEYRDQIESADADVIQNFVNLLTTNKTDFFREPQHFDFLIKKLIPTWQFHRKKEIKIWCCASSTGEEAYTIAMVLDAHLPKEITWQILASDIDTQVLSKASNGVYSDQKLVEIPPNYRGNLKLGRNKAEGWFKISDNLHSRIKFKKHNLMENNGPSQDTYDVIFCRNVLIYFEQNTIFKLMNKLHQSLSSGGYLFIGHSESIQKTQHLFNPILPAIYEKIPA